MILSEMNIPVKTVNALGKKKINTVNDLVMYFPRKYLDYRKLCHSWKRLIETVLFQGISNHMRNRQTKHDDHQSSSH